jgi:hypothetical protein
MILASVWFCLCLLKIKKTIYGSHT